MSSPPFIRINNLNYAGVPLLFGGVVAPLVAMALGGAILGGGPSNKAGAVDWPLNYGIVGVAVVVAIIGFFHAATSPVIWLELGDDVGYRKMFGEHRREWRDVESVAFEVAQSQVNTSVPGVAVPMGKHRILVLSLVDGSVLRVKITTEQEAAIQPLIQAAALQLAGEAPDGKDGDDRTPGYHFAHILFPGMVFEDPHGVYTVMAHPNGEEFLHSVWKSIVRVYGSDDDEVPDRFPAHLFAFGPHVGVVVTLPEPRNAAEAFMVAFVTTEPRDGEPEEPDPNNLPPARYFTLEKQDDELIGLIRAAGGDIGDGCPILCEWTRRGRHVNYGDGPAPDPAAFADELVRRFAGEPLDEAESVNA